MEDAIDVDMSHLRPQYLFGCELMANKDYHFKVDHAKNGHQLSLGTVSRSMNYEGSPIKVTLATQKMSVQPMVSLGGFEITPPMVLTVEVCGSGPVRTSGQHLVAVQEDAESEDEEEDGMSEKPSVPGGGNKAPQKKVRLAADEDDDDDADGDDEEEEEETEEKAPVKKSVQATTAKHAQKSNQSRKHSKPSTPGGTCGSKANKQTKQERIIKKPKGPGSIEDIKAKMQEDLEKSGSLPKVEPNFINYVKK
uniref:Nucleophosmin n=1 Tax=Otolemur garnettii TaxID=30611 RepID=H0XHM4_OTOGA